MTLHTPARPPWYAGSNLSVVVFFIGPRVTVKKPIHHHALRHFEPILRCTYIQLWLPCFCSTMPVISTCEPGSSSTTRIVNGNLNGPANSWVLVMKHGLRFYRKGQPPGWSAPHFSPRNTHTHTHTHTHIWTTQFVSSYLF